MSLEVLNFYTKDKLSTNRYRNILMFGTTFYLLVKIGEDIKEFTLQVPKKYRYERICSYRDFVADKVTEYNVLVDFVKNGKELVTEKWGLSEEEYEELIEGLKSILIKDFCTCGALRKWFLSAAVRVRSFIRKLVRRNKV